MEPRLETLRLSDYTGRTFGASVHISELPTSVRARPRNQSTNTRSRFRFPRARNASEEPPDLPTGDDLCQGENRLLGADAVRVEDHKQRDIPEDTWEQTRENMFIRLLCTSDTRAQAQKQKHEALQLQIQSEVNRYSAVCPTCSFRRVEARTETDRVHKPLRTPQQVLYVGLSYRFVLEVPVRLCGACDSAFSCCPIDVNCLPGSPQEAWDIVRCKQDHTPIWFDIELVKFVEEGTNVMRRTSVYKVAEWLDRTHVDNGCSSVVPFDKLRKGLGIVMREWGYVMCRMSDMRAMGVPQWPTGNYCCDTKQLMFRMYHRRVASLLA